MLKGNAFEGDRKVGELCPAEELGGEVPGTEGSRGSEVQEEQLEEKDQEGEEAREVRAPPIPDTPSREQVRLHRLTYTDLSDLGARTVCEARVVATSTGNQVKRMSTRTYRRLYRITSS